MRGKKKLSGRGILVKLILAMMLLSIISMVIILGVALNEQKQIMERNLIEENERLAGVAARSIEAGYIAQTLPFRTLHQINASEDVLFWWIVNPEGEIYLADNPEMRGKNIGSISWESRKTLVKDYVYNGEDIKFLVQPLEIGEPGKVEALCIGISLKSVREATNKMIITGLGYFLWIIAFAWALSFLLARRFTGPVTQLVEGTEAISRGEFDHRVAIKTGDEIEGLSDSFNNMAQRIKNAINTATATRKETENIMNTMINTLMVVDPKGKVVKANKAAFDLLGYSEAELIGTPFNKIIGTQDKETKGIGLEKRLKEAADSVANFETTYIAKDGREIPMNFSASVIIDEEGKLQGIVCDAGNISERKKADEERTALIKELEESYRKLTQSNRELRKIVYITSHHLQEPTRKVQVFGNMLHESVEGKLDADERENLQFMIDSSQRMEKLVKDIRSYSIVITKEKQLKRVDLNKVIAELKSSDLAAVLEDTRGTIFIPETLLSVQADPMQIRMLMRHLIVNGLTYHHNGIAPEITIRSSREENMVRVSVEDNGIGIPKEHYDTIFEMFQQLHFSKKGTGIGLAVCKKIVEQHGGEIGVVSTPGEGSRFWFTIPEGRGERGDGRKENGERRLENGGR